MNSPKIDPLDMTAEDRNHEDLEPCNHVYGPKGYYERMRLANIDRRNREALQRVTGTRFRGGVVSFA